MYAVILITNQSEHRDTTAANSLNITCWHIVYFYENSTCVSMTCLLEFSGLCIIGYDTLVNVVCLVSLFQEADGLVNVSHSSVCRCIHLLHLTCLFLCSLLNGTFLMSCQQNRIVMSPTYQHYLMSHYDLVKDAICSFLLLNTLTSRDSERDRV